MVPPGSCALGSAPAGSVNVTSGWALNADPSVAATAGCTGVATTAKIGSAAGRVSNDVNPSGATATLIVYVPSSKYVWPPLTVNTPPVRLSAAPLPSEVVPSPQSIEVTR